MRTDVQSQYSHKVRTLLDWEGPKRERKNGVEVVEVNLKTKLAVGHEKVKFGMYMYVSEEAYKVVALVDILVRVSHISFLPLPRNKIRTVTGSMSSRTG